MTGKSLPYRYFITLIIGMMAFALFMLSWPRLQASIRFLPVDTAISNYSETRDIDSAQLPGLISRAEQAISIHDHYRYWDGLSELQILRGRDMSQTIWVRRQALEDSITAAEEALKRAPANPRS